MKSNLNIIGMGLANADEDYQIECILLELESTLNQDKSYDLVRR
mgnify:CR=1 FL=1